MVSRALPFLLVALLWPLVGTAQDYVGSESCRACHEGVFALWQGSHHALAWTPPSEAMVLGAFDGATHEHKGATSRFTLEDGDYWITAEEPDGQSARYKVHSVAGIAPLQQYLLETAAGQLQAYDVAWDAEAERWYHLYPEQDLLPGQGLHWTGPYKNWNARCAACHATGYLKNYDPGSQTYQSTQSEIGVGCEACHGPGEAHLAWAEGAPTDAWPGLTAEAFTLAFGEVAEREIQQCAGCHSRREALVEGNPLPGTPFHDAYRLALLRDGLYHADGTILDEVYVYGSFLQSKMYAKGVRCSNCHEVHSAGLRAEGNGLCTQCHSPAGNPDFPSLRLAAYDDPAHHFHEPGTAGAQCKSCHMVERVYMGIDGRRDHSFRVPRPDLAAETGAPDACTDCHVERAPAWAAEQIAVWYPESRHRGRHYAQTLARGRADPVASRDALATLAEDRTSPAIVRATALSLIAPVADAPTAARLAPLLRDFDPLVRAAAVPLQRAAGDQDKVLRLVDLLSDPLKAVRIAAARELLDAPIARLPARQEQALRAALGEWQDSLRFKFDFPEGQMAIAGTGLVLRNLPAALAAFREAVRLDPQMVQAWRMIVTLELARGDRPAAKQAIDQALIQNPGDPLLDSIARQMR